MIKTVLVATDGSGHADRAVVLASEIAAKFHARLVAIHTLLHGASSETLHKVTNRKTLPKGLLLGSVSHKVSARAGCAVLTVR
jgi:nucleotide-binding universal stress UspA family protein